MKTNRKVAAAVVSQPQNRRRDAAVANPAKGVAENILELYEKRTFCEDFPAKCKRFGHCLEKCEELRLHIIRYVYEEDKEPFRRCGNVYGLLAYGGTELLPATVLNGELVKIEEYPTIRELERWLDINERKNHE
ncbi:arsenic metallochaperone ArsD family protein [Christensenellaceae bacterium OttesenSCG-928-K19]|nr:arsenic metallochaperone ArsD family protein [Christensenellaceae bacterium OttesenSCG-928-K19]